MSTHAEPTDRRTHPVWDLPTRLVHWLLVLLVVASWATQELGEMEWHKWSGYALLTLIGFRVLWGFIGSAQARFADFVRGPTVVWRYLRARPVAYRGHNPLGGWSVLVLLAVLLVQAMTGLFATDEILFDGPFRPAVDSDTASWLTSVHKQNFDLLLALVALHVAAVLFYRIAKGRDLIRPMLTGHDPKRPGTAPPAPWWRALAALALSAAALAVALALAPPPATFW